MNWEKLSDDRYMTDDGRYWAQFLDYPPDECWALWQAQEEPPAAKRSGRVMGFADTLQECKDWAAKDWADRLRAELELLTARLDEVLR